MPTSFLDLVPLIINNIESVKPKSVLDIGSGYCKYGHLIREYVDKYPWQIRLDSIEGFSQYSKRINCNPYDHYWYGTLEEFDPAYWETGFIAKYDLGLMIDVIEHWEKDQGKEMITKALEICDQLLISTPTNPAAQGAEYGNELEVHKSQWTDLDFAQLGNWVPIFSGHAVVGFLSK